MQRQSTTVEMDPRQVRQLVEQIGAWTILGVSGGRVIDRGDRLELPCGSGYLVHVELDVMDWYRVSRVKVDGATYREVGAQDEVYAWDVSEAVYKAGMFAMPWPEGGIDEMP